MLKKPILEIAADLRQKKYSISELVEYSLERAHQENEKLNAFINFNDEMAIAEAKKADQELKNNENPLFGIPIAHKDLFSTKGMPTTCGSKMLQNYVPPFDATVVERLKKAGAICIGKLNMDEFAMGSSSENSAFGPVKNPWDLTRVPGGSSGGTTAAVADHLVAAATGSDTGGSIRQPASFCGVLGLKPTYGRISRFGMVAFASSLDTVSFSANYASDLALLLENSAGSDGKDSTASTKPVEKYLAALENDISGLTIGLPCEFYEGLDSKIAQKIKDAQKVLKDLGLKFKEISLPLTKYSVPTYYIIAPAECSSNLARFDGIRYGATTPNPEHLDELYSQTRSESFGAEVKSRILVGTYVLSSNYYDSYFVKAQQVRRLIHDDFAKAFTDVDLILTPSTPTTAFKIGEKIADQITMFLNDIYTTSVSLAGLPAISIPIGLIDNLPIGMQLIGNHFAESRLLNVTHQLQKVLNFHQNF